MYNLIQWNDCLRDTVELVEYDFEIIILIFYSVRVWFSIIYKKKWKQSTHIAFVVIIKIGSSLCSSLCKKYDIATDMTF